MNKELLVNPELLPITPGVKEDPVIVSRDVDFNIKKPTWNNRYRSDLIPEKKPIYPYPVFQQEEKKTKSNKLLLVAGVALLLLSLK